METNNKKIIWVTIVSLIIIAGIIWLGFYLVKLNSSIEIQPDKINNEEITVLLDNQEDGILEESFFSFLAGLSATDINTIRQSDKFTSLLKTQINCNLSKDKAQTDCFARLNLRQVVILNKVALCSGLVLADSCYNSLAMINFNSQLCQSIKQTVLKDICSNFVYQNQAIRQSNITFCNNINDGDLKNNCFNIVISGHDDLSFCNNETVVNNNIEERCQSIILSKQAAQANDVTICQQIPLDNYKQGCLSEM